MSRPMALGFVLLILFLTSQSEWRANRALLDGASSSSKEQRLELHRDMVKDKIILDLATEKDELRVENKKLKAMVESLQRELSLYKKQPSSILFDIQKSLPVKNATQALPTQLKTSTTRTPGDKESHKIGI